MTALSRLIVAAILIVGFALATIDLMTLGLYLPFAAVGGYLVTQRPRNAIGWMLIGIGFTQVGTTAPVDLDLEALEAGTASLRDLAYVWVGTWAGGTSFLLYGALAMVFPSGHLPAEKWRWVVVACLIVGTVVVAAPAFFPSLRMDLDDFSAQILVPNPLGLLPDPGPDAVTIVEVITTVVPLAILAGAVVSLLVRYRRVRGIEALQIRWLLAAVAFVVVAVIFGLIGFIATDMTVFSVWIPALLAYPSVALSVGIAVTRYRLFDIDRIVSRTIAYALMTAVLFAVFAGVNLTLQAALGPVVRGNASVVAVSTLIVAALFQPVRVRLQRAVDRRFNRSRYDAERTVQGFSGRLRDEVDLPTLVGALKQVAVEAVEPSKTIVWLRQPKPGQ